MANGGNLPSVDPIAKRVWRNAQILSGLGDSEEIRQLCHFGAPRFVRPRFRTGTEPPNLTNFCYNCQRTERRNPGKQQRGRNMAKILFLHGWKSVPGGVKPTYLKD